MLFAWPWTHIDADFGDQSQGCRLVDSINFSQIDTRDSERLFSDWKFRLVSPLLLFLTSSLQFREIGFRYQTLQMRFNLMMAAFNLLLIRIEQLQTLFQCK